MLVIPREAQPKEKPMPRKDKKPNRSKPRAYTQEEIALTKKYKEVTVCEHGKVSYQNLVKLVEGQQARMKLDDKLHNSNQTLVWNLRHAADEAENTNAFLQAQILDLKKDSSSKDKTYLPKELIEKIRAQQQVINTLKAQIQESKDNVKIKKGLKGTFYKEAKANEVSK